MIELKRNGVVCVLVLRSEPLSGDPLTIYRQADARDVTEVVTAGDPEITKLLNAAGWWQSSITTERMRELESKLADANAKLAQLQIQWPAGLLDRTVRADEIDEDPEWQGPVTLAAREVDRLRRVVEDRDARIEGLIAELEAEKRRSDERVNAITDAAVPVSDLEEERRIVRRVVREAFDLMRRYLESDPTKKRAGGPAPISSSYLATNLNDAVHDWIGCVEEGGWCNDQVEMRALNEHIEKRVLGQEQTPKDAPRFELPAELPTLPTRPPARPSLADRAVGGVLRLLDKIG